MKINMDSTIVYISLNNSNMIHKQIPKVKDIATVLCDDKDLKSSIEDIKLPVKLTTDNSQEVVSFLKVIELITNKFHNIIVTPLGPQETIIYYKPLGDKKPLIEKLKALFLILLAFLGTGYSIMSYNGDVSTDSLLTELYTLFTGQNASEGSNGIVYGIIAYSVGLCMGMIIFFNHGINKNSQDDPTPLQVQMRLYEQQVNTCIAIDSTRKKETIDVD